MWQWYANDLGDPHPVLGTNTGYYMPDGATARIEAGTWELLGQQRLARGQRVNPLLVDTLRVLGSADREFYGWTAYPAASKREGGGFFTGARDRDAVRVLVDDDAVLLQPLPDHRYLAAGLVEVLPPVESAEVRDLAVPRTPPARPVTVAAGRSPLAHPEPEAGDPDRDLIIDLMHAPRDAIHQIYAAVTGARGRSRSVPITAVDLTDHGRVITYTNTDDGTEYIHLAGGSGLVRLLENTAHTL
ncbi:ESX secretion-associated protein EspG [Amycolatopsis sp. TNS106]|uniref:ESX secretion-associated protein EspG n=1 Tax=Amycolatopsis sp. TNS106 TaxID=2861750 RepID=UPI0021040B4F|nr:ESX secretion-associated protein EspG [Amycolatopsis sp. TNS106]